MDLRSSTFHSTFFLLFSHTAGFFRQLLLFSGCLKHEVIPPLSVYSALLSVDTEERGRDNSKCIWSVYMWNIGFISHGTEWFLPQRVFPVDENERTLPCSLILFDPKWSLVWSGDSRLKRSEGAPWRHSTGMTSLYCHFRLNGIFFDSFSAPTLSLSLSLKVRGKWGHDYGGREETGRGWVERTQGIEEKLIEMWREWWPCHSQPDENARGRRPAGISNICFLDDRRHEGVVLKCGMVSHSLSLKSHGDVPQPSAVSNDLCWLSLLQHVSTRHTPGSGLHLWFLDKGQQFRDS